MALHALENSAQSGLSEVLMIGEMTLLVYWGSEAQRTGVPLVH